MKTPQEILKEAVTKKEPVLKLWNCQAPRSLRKRSDDRWREARYIHLFIAAYSVSDAVKLIAEYTGGDGDGFALHLRKYSSPVWGSTMTDVVPERGMWVQFGDHAKPERVI